MEQLLNEKKSPVEWSIKHQALLVLCIIEINTVPKIITEILKDVMRSVRFTAFHKFSNSDNSVQIDNLTFDDLRYILLKYHIPDDPEKVFQLKKNNILFEPLHKYPDYHAVNQTYNSDEIQHIESLVAVFIKKKIMEDLNLSESILPELDANSKIVLWNY
jgi:hypothetical protein